MRGVGDTLQFPQRVGATQLMFGLDIGVVGRPGVVHRHATEQAEHAHVVDALAAALGVAGDQGVAAGAGAVHPMQLAGDPQPGLVEPGGLGLDDAVLDLVEEPVQPVGGPRGHGRDGALGHRGAEQFGQCLGGAFLRYELAHRRTG